jgi:hypothetical protein
MIKNNDESYKSDNVPVAKKRGRKSKKEIESLAKLQNKDNNQFEITDNINVIIEEIHNSTEIDINNIHGLLISDEESINDTSKNEQDIPIAKKRGRKPKGGKIIQQLTIVNNDTETKPSVILHLKCSIKDLQTDLLHCQEIQSFNFQPTNQLPFESINSNLNIFNNKIEEEIDNKSINENDTKEVWKKLKILEHNLHINNISDKKSACFWCTYDFDNPPVYIPKYFIKDSYHVYGCFCSPECGTAYLMEENIDSSSKFERYHHINHIYSKVYDYKKNIKPAPNPYYMLEKYYGNLTIQEYRSLLRNERLFLVVDKPLTRILPELHEDNDDFIINNKIIPSNNYQLKKKLIKKQNKNNILSEKFGLTAQS